MNVALSDFEQYTAVEDDKLCPQGCDIEFGVESYWLLSDQFRFCPVCGAKLIKIQQIITRWRIKGTKPLSRSGMATMIQQHFLKEMKRALEQSPACCEKLMRRA